MGALCDWHRRRVSERSITIILNMFHHTINVLGNTDRVGKYTPLGLWVWNNHRWYIHIEFTRTIFPLFIIAVRLHHLS